ncbi:restriction endonuclease subunit S [Actinobacillus pleuropneumoniae]|uniref:Type I restriction enzyme EcoR124II specificity protein n=1 Tax=Actinobacillus pleuropneumoniae TaxID=715 RepID=A0A448TX52_ACTPL|nr:restriction endonuclease subunit S [Actinobacillus pleuropneumoniae]EFL78690.1 hypothetical protein APP2_1506 [Actinobacillus pleuropneumoniae serovar 2 str. 4226]EFM88405.1 Restriction modification system DNA specificity domain [Actinobacillus pleuropneumoniae serovar 2 str. S1536]MEE3618735.1 restriction endonuclease subunit S [Actinobacillus pleuropneumoniae]UKH45046.1 restriction endonuclease subunit S [Actinobacillus pleuropneumoniae serovar 2 str. S1536]VEJ16223.1 type I restriction e
MNILELIKDCEVEWKSLGEVAKYVRGLTYNKTNESDEKAGGYYVLRANNITLSNNQLNFDDVKLVKFDTKTKPEQKLYKDDILISAASGSKEHVGKVAFISENMDFYFGGFMGVVRCSQEILPRFLFHILTSSLFKTYLNEVLNSSTINNLNAKVMNEFQIPIPPLEIQEKIVKILDKFTELEATLEATLEAELSLRVKQYNYYRDLLLNENDKNPFFKNTEYRCLGDITLVSSNIKWKNNTNTYKYIDLTSVDRENHSIGETIKISALTAPSRAQKLVAKDDVIFATTRPTQLRFAFINEEFANSIASTGYCVLRANPNLVLPKWIYHNLGSIDFKNFLEENQSGSAYPAVSDSKVKDYKIPVPSLDVQEKIIAILDNFENLANSIKNGLPREIELRRKQYEYYRNELLDFSR